MFKIENAEKIQSTDNNYKYKFKITEGEVKTEIVTTNFSKINFDSELCKIQKPYAYLNFNECTAPARNIRPTITHGSTVELGKYPWHTAIFKISYASLNYICGGSLINSNTILTAAHCLIEYSNELSPDMLSVRLGTNKLFEGGKQHSVRKIKIHKYFHYTNYRHDIALMRLRTTVKYTNYIRPICLTNFHFENKNLEEWMPGWSLNENGTQLNNLRDAAMPGRTNEECKEVNEEMYRDYFDAEYSFCAGNVNGTSICDGDSGGGLVFERNNSWFIRGIANLAASTEFGCDLTKFAFFTDVVVHFDWIQDTLKSFILEILLGETISDSSVADEINLKHSAVVTDDITCDAPARNIVLNSSYGNIVPKGYYPWHAAIFKQIDENGTIEYVCGGSLINSNTILTVANILNDMESSPDKYFVRLGITELLDRGDQHYIRKVVVHEYQDIALLRLIIPVKFSNYIRPICISNIDLGHTHKTGWLPGWNFTEESTISNFLLDSSIPVVNNEICIYDIVNFSESYGSKNYFCTRNINGSNSLTRGGGLVYELNNKWFIRGILSRTPSRITKLKIFTNVTHHYEWIYKTLNTLSLDPENIQCISTDNTTRIYN